MNPHPQRRSEWHSLVGSSRADVPFLHRPHTIKKRLSGSRSTSAECSSDCNSLSWIQNGKQGERVDNLHAGRISLPSRDLYSLIRAQPGIWPPLRLTCPEIIESDTAWPRLGLIHCSLLIYLTRRPRAFAVFFPFHLEPFTPPSSTKMIRALVAAQLLASAVALHLPRDLRIRQDSSAPYTIDLNATQYGLRYEAPVTFGSQTFSLTVDTGSSDVFVVEDDFQCVGPLPFGDPNELHELKQSACGYATAGYSTDKKSDDFEIVDDESFQATYGAGTSRGRMATEDLSLGGATVDNQRFGLVNWTTPMNFGSSGILGLAYPLLTSAIDLNDTTDSQNISTQPYTPFVMKMAREDIINPLFSLAINRIPRDEASGDGGVLVLGGLPDIELAGDWAVVPAEAYEGAETDRKSYWATTMQALTYGDDGEYTTPYQIIVDSGSPQTMVPLEVADAFNKLFSPPASWSEMSQGYIVDCDAEAPSLSMKIGGITFDINPDDLILQQDSAGFVCQSAITRAIDMPGAAEADARQLYLLGVNFLRNVVAEFNWGNSTMRFAARKDSAASSLEILGSGRFVVLVAMVVLFQGFF